MMPMNENETLTQKDVLQLLLNVTQHSVTREELTSVRQELKQDISELKAELKQDIAEVKQSVIDLRTELKQDISDLRTELKQDIAEVKQSVTDLRTEFKQDNADIRTEIKSVTKTLSNLQWLIVAAVFGFYLKDTVLAWFSSLAN